MSDTAGYWLGAILFLAYFTVGAFILAWVAKRPSQRFIRSAILDGHLTLPAIIWPLVLAGVAARRYWRLS